MAVQIETFSHLVLRVADLEASLRFYRDVLGLPVLFEMRPEDFPEGGPRLHAVGCRAGDVVLELTRDPDRSGPVETQGSPVIALAVADIEAAHAAVREAGITPRMPPTEMLPGLFMLFLADPDGRTVELAQFPGGARSSLEYNRRDSTR